jgi:hypothetical protein
LTVVYEERHLIDPPSAPRDRFNHLYTLIVRPDSSFVVMLDRAAERSASLLTDFATPAEIDPEDPFDWYEDAATLITDPNMLEPPDFYVDSGSYDEMPDDWSNEVDGEWTPPLVPKAKSEVGRGEYVLPTMPNPKYKGESQPPIVPESRYRGEGRKIANPAFVLDEELAKLGKIYGAGFGTWCRDTHVALGNVHIGNDENAVREWNQAHFVPKAETQRAEKKGDRRRVGRPVKAASVAV